MSEHPYYNQEVHGPYELFDLGNFPWRRVGRCVAASWPMQPLAS